MFSELSNITKIDFSEFDTSYVINMSRMFSGCIRLTSLDLSNFITSKVIVMNGMFQESGLISLNLSNFDTSSVINMNGMFYSCKSIISVNLKNFDTSLVTNFHSMFQECNSLKYLDLSSFRTPSLLDIGNMFQNCYSLISVNLDNFDTSKVTSMSVMFYGCSSLVSLNLNSFNTSSLGYIHSVFENVNNNIAFCADNLKLSESSKFTINCEDLCFTSETKKFIVEKRQCILHCTNDDKYIFEYDNRCYESCPNETHITSDNKFLCRKNPKGYYLDKENDIYKPCYSTCEICKGEGNEHEHNCILCKLNYILLLNPENIYNCYKECDYYFYFNSLGEYKCTVNNECPNEYSKLIELKRKCVDNCTNDDTFIFEKNNICVDFFSEEEIIKNCPLNLPYEKNNECVEECNSVDFLNKICKINNKNNQTTFDNIIKSIKNDIQNKSLKPLLSSVINEEKKEYIIEDNETIYQITSSYNQNNKLYKNMSTILLGLCEKNLKNHYGIDENKTLIIFKIDIFEQGLLIPIIEYEIYNPDNLEKLDLSYCEDNKIEIFIPVSINENNLFKYNSSDKYYNDICNTYTTEFGTDIIIKDRQNEYIDNNMSLCESNCEYIDYNTYTKKVLCKCKSKNNLESISKIKNTKDKLLKNFVELKNAINLNIMKCYKILFSKKGLINNIGSYIMLSIILIYIISLFLFIFKGYNIINNIIQNLVKTKEKNMYIKRNSIKKNNIKKNSIKRNTIKINNIKRNSVKKRNTVLGIKSIKKDLYLNDENEKGRKKSLKKKSMRSFNLRNRLNIPPSKNNRNKNKLEIPSKINSKLELKDSENRIGNHKKNTFRMLFMDNNKDKNDQIKINNYSDYELNTLSYEKALEIDKRTYFQFYFSLLKQKHLLIFTFNSNNDYNSKIIKICLFFFSFALYYTVNSLFFNYSTMHKIYQDKGTFNFIFQLPQIIYSTLISGIINIIVKSLSLSQNNIIELKKEKKNITQKVKRILKCLKIKFVFFFILSFLFLFSFWYYLSSFCAIYINTQGHLIKDTLISFFLSLIYPIFLNLLPGFFRIPALRSKKKSKKCLYLFSKIIQII